MKVEVVAMSGVPALVVVGQSSLDIRHLTFSYFFSSSQAPVVVVVAVVIPVQMTMKTVFEDGKDLSIVATMEHLYSRRPALVSL
jgi:hypothetical protein